MMTYRRGFSLVELLVVIGVIGVIVGLALPAVQAARDTASRAACQNRLRQLGVGLHDYHAAHRRFPNSGWGVNPAAVGPATPDEVLTWMANVLPHLEQQALYDQAFAACRAERLAYLDPPHAGNSTPVAAFVCPADGRLTLPLATPSGRSAALASYIGVAGSAVPLSFPSGQQKAPGGGFDWSQSVRLTDVADGTSNTIHVAERPSPDTAQAGDWYQSGWGREDFPGPSGTMHYFQPPSVFGDPCPGSLYGPGRTDNPCDRYHFWSLHRGGANFLYCDGAVRFLPYTARSVMSALCTRSGNESVEQP